MQVANACESNPTPATKFVQVLNCGGGWGFSVSPNPNQGRTTIATTKTSTQSVQEFSQTKIYQLKVLDQLGTVRKQYNYSGGTTSTTINLSDLIQGIYIIQAFNGSSWLCQQIIKQ